MERSGAKKLAAEKAVLFINDGMTVGLGTGSTAYWAIKKMGELVKDGLSIVAVASSVASEKLAKECGITLVNINSINSIDVTIDGADEIDNNYCLIKGGGGALVREKILAAASKKFIVVADVGKLVTTLGSFPLPVEVVPFAANLTFKKLEQLGCTAIVRKAGDKDFISDNGNLIADCYFKEIAEPAILHSLINAIPGVVDNGLFLPALVTTVIIGFEDGSVKQLS